MAKIYTKTGDKGETGLVSGERVSKDDLRIQAYGTVDETNSSIGAARSFLKLPDLDNILAQIQDDLFVMGSFLASRRSPEAPLGDLHNIDAARITFLETSIDGLTAKLPPLKNFVLPGGSQGASLLHVSRTVCRRAERLVVALARSEPVAHAALIYLNRLSDFLFVAARTANQATQTPEVIWSQPSKKK